MGDETPLTTEPTVDEFLLQWIAREHIDDARVTLHCAVQVYREDEQGGTAWARVKAADDNLEAIQSLAGELCRKIASMPVRAKWAILEHGNNTGRIGTFAEWLVELRAAREETLLPLTDLASGARAYLPVPPSRGRPKKNVDNPLHVLVHEVARVYREFGVPNDGKGKRGRENPTVTFVRALLARLQVSAPDDLSRLIRRAAKKS
jgi:hypothetical protein